MIIYMCTNKTNGKRYIGQTTQTLNRRKRGHYGNNDTTYFHNTLRKYDEDIFEWEIIYECVSRKEMDDMECYFIKHYNTSWEQHGYNLKEGGSSPRHSDITRQKISENCNNSGEHNPMYGRKHTEDTRKILSEQRKGNKYSNKKYNVIMPNGENVMINGLKDFCNEQGLIYSSVHTYMKRGKPYKGYFVTEGV